MRDGGEGDERARGGGEGKNGEKGGAMFSSGPCQIPAKYTDTRIHKKIMKAITFAWLDGGDE